MYEKYKAQGLAGFNKCVLGKVGVEDSNHVAAVQSPFCTFFPFYNGDGGSEA